MQKSLHIKTWKEDNIIFCKYADKTYIDIDIAKQCVKARSELSNGTSYLTLIDLTGVKSINKKAREYLSTEGIQDIEAGAYLVGSPLSKMIGNVFLKINQPQVPFRLFNDNDSAKQWLQSFLKDS